MRGLGLLKGHTYMRVGRGQYSNWCCTMRKYRLRPVGVPVFKDGLAADSNGSSNVLPCLPNLMMNIK